MKLIFLDRITLKYKDNAYVSSEFEIVLDSVVKQKSNFTVNKEEIKASVGDIVVLKEGKLSYIGRRAKFSLTTLKRYSISKFL